MTITLTWHGADGVAIPLDGSTGYLVTRGALGLDVPPTTNFVDPYAAFDGGALINRRRNSRAVTLPILVRDDARAQTLLATLAASLQGPGRLTYSDGTVTVELRSVVYDGGMPGDQSRTVTPTRRQVVAGLLALDPWWYGSSNSLSLSTSAATAFDAVLGFDAAIPFDGGSAATVFVAGAGEAFPVVTITGPATTATVSYGTLGWSIAAPLVAGDVLVVDSRPGSRGPRLNGGVVNWSLLTGGSRLFALQPGSTTVLSGVTGASGATTITMQWEPRYLTP